MSFSVELKREPLALEMLLRSPEAQLSDTEERVSS